MIQVFCYARVRSTEVSRIISLRPRLLENPLEKISLAGIKSDRDIVAADLWSAWASWFFRIGGPAKIGIGATAAGTAT